MTNVSKKLIQSLFFITDLIFTNSRHIQIIFLLSEHEQWLYFLEILAKLSPTALRFNNDCA